MPLRSPATFRLSCLLLTAGALVCGFPSPPVAGAAEPGDSAAASPKGHAFFEEKIRPVLVEHCYKCHSSKAEKIKGGLLVDSRDGLLSGGDSGPSLVPGKPDESPILHSLSHNGEFPEMPPKERLPDHVVTDFAEWIRMGAPDPRKATGETVAAEPGIDIEAGRKFWAFQAPKNPSLPLSDPKPATSAGPIDQYILAGLRDAGLPSAPPAARRTLIRRLTFDLTGLPPTPEEIDDYLADKSPEATPRLVDRLLGSPHFGEHWGRHWLDLARYADSNGGDINLTYHNAWRYRNYVIAAFNNDKPYDSFIREQVAGDLLPYDDEAQRAAQLTATGFLMIGPKMLSERNKEKMHLDIVDEQVDTVGRVFMGLTLGCARCHDHKFDPVPAEDYYAMAGIFRSTVTANGIRMNNVNVSGWMEQELPMPASLKAEVDDYRQRKESLDKKVADLKNRLEKLKKATGASAALGIVVDNTRAEITGYWKESTSSPHYFGDGYIHDDKLDKGKKSIVWTPDLPAAGEYEVRIAYAHNTGRASAVPVQVRHADGEQALTINQVTEPLYDKLWDVLGRFRFEKGKAGSVILSTEGTEGYVIADAVQFIPVAELDKQTNNSAAPEASELAEVSQALKVAEKDLKNLQENAPKVPSVMAAQDRDLDQVGDVAIRIRGEVGNEGPVVRRGFLQVASRPDSHHPEIPSGQSGRAELAEWLASPGNPLTARVMANRVWQHLFSEGLVRTVDNFGELGDRPSHPELLDYLAARFVENGWSVKSLIREIVLTDAYQMATVSRDPDKATLIDPENRLLWRQNVKRLPGESIRDAMLAAAGQLVENFPESPVSALGEQAIDNSRSQAGGVSIDDHRLRSLYLPMVRNDMPPFLEIFDMANPDMVTGKRPDTTVPSQALLMLNSPFVRDMAAATIESLQADPEKPALRLRELYARVLGRLPAEYESDAALTYIQELQREEDLPAHEAWAAFCHALFASTEFRFVE